MKLLKTTTTLLVSLCFCATAFAGDYVNAQATDAVVQQFLNQSAPKQCHNGEKYHCFSTPGLGSRVVCECK